MTNSNEFHTYEVIISSEEAEIIAKCAEYMSNGTGYTFNNMSEVLLGFARVGVQHYTDKAFKPQLPSIIWNWVKTYLGQFLCFTIGCSMLLFAPTAEGSISTSLSGGFFVILGLGLKFLNTAKNK